MLPEPDLRPSRSREELLTVVYSRAGRLRLLRRLRIAVPIALATALVAGTLPLLLDEVKDDARRITPAEERPRQTAPAESARPEPSRALESHGDKTSRSLRGVGPAPRRAADTATSTRAGDVVAYMDAPDPDGPWDIYVRRLGSDRARNLTPGPGHDGEPAWSPDATKIAFTSVERPDHDHLQIYVMDADGSHQDRLTHTDCSATPMCQDAMPTWSPDGSQIAFERRLATPPSDAIRSGKEYNGQIWVMDADGSNAHRLAPGYGPEWSPDGKHIAFFSGVGSTNPCPPTSYGIRNCEDQLYMMDPDGSNIRPLGVTGHTWTSWWPDGSRLTFSHQASSTDRVRIWTIRPDGTGLKALTTSEQGYSYEPAVSPDARRIVFVRFTGGSDSLWVMNSDGTGQRELRGNFGVGQYRPEFAPRRS